MEQQKREKGFPIAAVLAALVLIAGICAAMIPSLRTYREQVRAQAVYAEGMAVYYAAQDVIRQAAADGVLADGTITSQDGKDSGKLSGQLSEELMGLVQSDYQIAVEGGRLSSVTVTDGKYYVSYDADGVKDMNFQLPEEEEDATE